MLRSSARNAKAFASHQIDFFRRRHRGRLQRRFDFPRLPFHQTVPPVGVADAASEALQLAVFDREQSSTAIRASEDGWFRFALVFLEDGRFGRSHIGTAYK